MAQMLGLNWSGKEDSNLRPLPPEDADPASTRRFSVTRRGVWPSYDRICSCLIPARGSDRGSDPCPSSPKAPAP